MPEDLTSIVADLGGTLSALCFSAYLIIFLLKQFAAERQIHLDKDSRNDDALRELMTSSNAALISTMEKTNQTLSEMRVAIASLHESIINKDRP